MPEKSAKLLDYPIFSIHADHRGMCKFSNAEDGNYKLVAETLERWAKELKGETQEKEKEKDTKTVGPTSFLSEAVTNVDARLGNMSRIPSLGTTTRGTNLESSRQKAQRTLVVVGPW